MNEIKLLPCPFCGKTPQITSGKKLSSLGLNKNYPDNGRGLYIESIWYEAECVCMKLAKAFKTEDEAAAAWNHRTPEIVRCGECIYWTDGACKITDREPPADGFCSLGKRKEATP